MTRRPLAAIVAGCAITMLTYAALAHNTRSHQGGMARYLKAVTEDANLETLFLNMQSAGLGVTMKKR